MLILLECLIAILLFSSSPYAFASWDAKAVQIDLPTVLPEPAKDGIYYLQTKDGQKHPLTIIHELQYGLKQFILQHGNPIAAVVVIEAATGHILAMAQGKDPSAWDSKTHTALYEGFPAASLFKMVTTIAALDIAKLDPDHIFNLYSDCGHVNAQGMWLTESLPVGGNHSMTLRQAFATSCNSFYAKLSINYVGLGMITQYAKKLGWGSPVAADFMNHGSPINPPSPALSSTYTVGRFAAGFGMVGLSPIHAAWINLAIAHDGKAMPLSLFADSSAPVETATRLLFSQEIAVPLRDIMNKTVLSGTAAPAFREGGGEYSLKSAGGKTGTLNGFSPTGLTTWFAGLMPYDNPQVVVSAVVVNEDKWFIKGPHLAAEAFRLWSVMHSKSEEMKAEISLKTTASQPEKLKKR